MPVTETTNGGPVAPAPAAPAGQQDNDGWVILTWSGTSYYVPASQQVYKDGQLVWADSLPVGDPIDAEQYAGFEERISPIEGGEPSPAATPAQPPSGQAAQPSSGTLTSPSTDDETSDGTEEQEDFREVPPDGKLWHIDGKVYLVWDVIDPDTGERAGVVGWHITDQDRLDEIVGELDVSFDFDGTLQQAEQQGFIDGGTEQELADFGEANPLDTFYEDYEEQFSLSPIYGDPEFLGLLVQATFEGRDVTDSELAGTAYWSSRTESQRAWDNLVLQDPATARQRMDDNRRAVRSQLQAAGYLDAPDSLVNYLSDRYTTGEWSQERLQMQVTAEIDPYAAGASPFAGIFDWSNVDPSWRVITDGENFWVRTPDGDFVLDGVGQAARFTNPSDVVQVNADPPAGRHVAEGGVHYLVLDDGGVLAATGEGQVAGLTRLYGKATEPGGLTYPIRGGGTPLADMVTGTVVDHFGGPGGIESYGSINQVGTATDLAEQIGGGPRETTQLGGEEEVRALIRQYVGPYHAANYTDDYVAEWAGRIRNGAPGMRDLLVQELQRQFQSAFPGYDANDLSYEAVAAPARGLWQAYSGNAVNEGAAEWLQFLQLGPDAVNREGWLRRHGNRNGWAPVVNQAVSALESAFGSQVRGSML